jgi:hypothetical protein
MAVGGMDVLAAAHAYLSGGKGVVGDRRRVREKPAGHAAPLRLVIAAVWVRVVVLQRHRHLGVAELSELRDGPAEPDLARRDVDKADRDKPTLELAVVDHQMGDGPSTRVNDQAAHLAADPIGTADVSPDRQ